MARIVIYCDFDGTITEKDNIIAIMKEFAPPQWEELKEDILGQKISIQEGVGKLFRLLPTSLKNDIIQFTVKHAKVRMGFRELLAFAKQVDIPFYIVSGGIDFFVDPILAPYGPVSDIYYNRADFSNEKMEILWPNACDEQCQNGCGCCKPSVMRKVSQPNDFKIVIGDSITDLEVAKQADYVFAREFLAEKCGELAIKHHRFETFFDCIDEIKRLKGVEVTSAK
ncbi:2-hydroxy-3-keto-5-methylthiopentenyl-1-phosphate phosphatase [Pseudoneobacillus sp. C159]